MKIFKIKFDSKMPTTRKVTVGKDDDFGLAIQIDGLQSQGPAKLLYAGQEVEANKDLIEGYNVFLLKAVKDSTLAIKDIDSQVTFQVDISIKKTDVVELGGAGSGGGGDAVWEFDGQCTYSIPGVLSVDSCYRTIKSVDSMTFMPVNGQASIGVYQDGYTCISAQRVCIEAPCDICIKGGQVKIYDYDGRETLNIGSSQQWFGNSCNSTTIKGNNITMCSDNSLNLYANCIDVNVQGYTIFEATNTYVTFGNCEKQFTQFGRCYQLYVSNVGNIIDATNTDKVIFGASQKNNDIVGHYVTLSATEYCGKGAININGATNISGSIKFDPSPCGGCSTAVYLNGGYCGAANDYNVKFVLPNNLEFYGTCTCEAIPQLYYARSKVFLTLLSALETTYHNSCSNDDKNYNVSQVDINVYNKLTSLFAI